MKKPFVVIIGFVILLLAGWLYLHEGSLAVNPKNTQLQEFVIPSGATTNQIIDDLAKEDLIRSKLAFLWVIKRKGIEKNLQAGTYILHRGMNAGEIAETLTHGTDDVVVTIPEGLRREEIAEIVSKILDVSEAEFITLAEEGYLYPDTYAVSRSMSAEDFISMQRTTFNQKYTDELQEKANELGLTDREVLILASILEREAKKQEDFEGIANVLVKRYFDDYPLQVDATIQYALGYQPDEKRWWKSTTYFRDLEIDSPYNTYKNTGLPPTPITSPGIRAIEAVVNADPDTPYMFYLSEPDGTTHYAKTFEEHERNIEKYLR